MKIAYFSPLNPLRSGISDYSEELLPYLSKYAEIDLFVDFEPTNPVILKNFKIYDYRKFKKLRKNYDVALYHMGNSPYHKFIYYTLIKYPGVVVLHDWVLHHFFASLRKFRYLKELLYAYGKRGIDIGLRVLTGVDSSSREKVYFTYPLNKHVIKASVGVIAHSEYIKSRIELNYPDKKVIKINSHCPDFIIKGWNIPQNLRKKYGFEEDEFIILTPGKLTPNRRVDKILQAISLLTIPYKKLKYVVVGEVFPCVGYLVKRQGIYNFVKFTGFTKFKDFYNYIALADVCVLLRYPTAGETSAALVKVMGMGKPCLVSNVDWYSELPSECVIKIDVNDYEVEQIYEYLKLLIENEHLRRKLGANAREYIVRFHHVESSAKKYIEFLKQCIR